MMPTFRPRGAAGLIARGAPLRSRAVRYRRMPIEIESPEELGYGTIANNLAESSFSDLRLADYGIDADVGGLLLQYGDHRGLPELRELIAGAELDVADVLVTPGAAAALFVVATTLLEPGDHALVVRPNYATNVETPRAIGAAVEYLDLRFEEGWALDPCNVAAALRPATRLVSVCLPHNPTGRTLDGAALGELVALVERHGGARLLVDETYRELAYGDPAPPAASLSDRVVAVSSLSKAYGLPGLRIGWICSRDAALLDRLLAAKEQILIAGSLLDETLAARVLARRGAVLPDILAAVRERRAIVADWIAGQQHFEWQPPQAGVVCFPRLRPERGADPGRFYDVLLREHGTYVGPGHWFEQDRRHFRLGFGWPGTEQLRRGLAALTAAARAAE
jgi:aspartate/methionine/tyrosine aminotransferase